MAVSIQADVSGTSGTVKVNSNTAFTFDSAGVLNATTVQHNGVATERISLGAAVATTSGTAVDFTGIPSWAKKITVMFNGVSTNGVSAVCIQLGSGSVQTTGYLSIGHGFSSSGGVAAIGSTTSIVCEDGSVTNMTRFGNVRLLNFGSGNIWTAEGGFVRNNSYAGAVCQGGVTLPGVLDRVRVTTVGGTDVFDAGSVNILIEG